MKDVYRFDNDNNISYTSANYISGYDLIVFISMFGVKGRTFVAQKKLGKKHKKIRKQAQVTKRGLHFCKLWCA